MTITSGGIRVTARLGGQGRIVLPAAVRKAAHIGEGDALIISVDAGGRIIAETADAIEARVHAAAPTPSGVDTVEDVREMRREDAALSDARDERQRAATAHKSDEEVAAAGGLLLARLGLA